MKFVVMVEGDTERVDLYGLPFAFPKRLDKEEKIDFARKKLTNLVDKKLRHRFRQHFAVFEIEAWLLSDPALFKLHFELPARATNNPEGVDFDKPSARLLDEFYRKSKNQGYKKVVHGRILFKRLDTELAYKKCPHLKRLLDEMSEFATSSAPKP
jgi:hypothetical protein